MKPGRRGARKGSLGTRRERHSSTDLQHKWQKIKLATPGWVRSAASISGQPQGMSTQQPVTPSTLRLQYTGTATSSCEIPSGDSGTRRTELGQALPGSNSGCSGSPGAAKSLIPELARIKPAWDCLWLQGSLGSNWPWFSTTPNAEMWVLTHSMVRRTTQGLWRHWGSPSSPTQGRIYTQNASSATGEVCPATDPGSHRLHPWAIHNWVLPCRHTGWVPLCKSSLL